MLQTDRRRDPYPFTWEVPAGILAATLLLAALGIQVGRSLAQLAAGAGWRWPTGRTLFTSIPAILAGQAGAGLDPAPTPAATGSAVVACVAAIELILASAVATTVLLALRRWGPDRMKGMATPAEAEASLGLSRLRAQRHIIRPDLYPPRHRGRKT